jgi:hypothetical protein
LAESLAGTQNTETCISNLLSLIAYKPRPRKEVSQHWQPQTFTKSHYQLLQRNSLLANFLMQASCSEAVTERCEKSS